MTDFTEINGNFFVACGGKEDTTLDFDFEEDGTLYVRLDKKGDSVFARFDHTVAKAFVEFVKQAKVYGD